MARTVREDANLQPAKPLKPTHLSERAPLEWDRLMGESSSPASRLLRPIGRYCPPRLRS